MEIDLYFLTRAGYPTIRECTLRTAGIIS